jgi:hypothetical protein
MTRTQGDLREHSAPHQVALGRTRRIAFRPPARTLAQNPIIIPACLDHTLQADVARHLKAVGLKQEGCKEARDTAVSIPERVNAKEIEDQRGHDQERWNRFVLTSLSVIATE